jgi:gustatory receptor
VRTETIALSGMNFFYFTRKMVLGAAATVVTYELVLLQFDQETIKKELLSKKNFCD